MLQQETSTRTAAEKALRVVRLPGIHGPVVRLAGRLDRETREEFDHWVKLLAPLGHSAIVLNLRGLSHLDSPGIAALADAARVWRRIGTLTVLVAGTGAVARLLSLLSLDLQVLTVATEAEASETLDFFLGPPVWPERSWTGAEQEALRWWQDLAEDLPQLPPTEAARKLTSMHALCEASEDAVEREGVPGMTRCEVCPLFHALGGTEADIGCGRIIDPALAALGRADIDQAAEGVSEMVRVLERMDGTLAGV